MKNKLLFLFTFLTIASSIYSQAPLSPVLILPPPEQTRVIATVTLDWQDCTGAAGYFVEIGTDASQIQNGPLVDSTNSTTSQFTFLPGKLQANTNYYWRVTARNSFGMGLPSEIRHFRTVGSTSQETFNIEGDVNALVASNELSAVQGNILNNMLESAKHQIDLNHDVMAMIGLVLVDARLFILRISGMISNSNMQRLISEVDYIIAVIRQGDNSIGTGNEYLTEKTFSLKQNYPNPFNPSTTIEYSVPANSFVSLKVYDIQGREIATIINKQQDAGSYITTWNASSVSSGVYFYKLTAGNYTQTKKMLLSK